MSNVFTLESLDDEINREFKPLTFEAGGEEYVLRNLLRVGKKDRDQVMERLKALEAEKEASEDEESESSLDEDTALETVQFVIKTVTADGKGSKLLKVLGDDLLRNMKVLEHWTEATQPGEATDSPA